MKSIIKDSLILFAITICSGFILGAVYNVTKEPIARQQQQAKEEACREVFEDAASFQSEVIEDSEFAIFEDGNIDEVLAALDDKGVTLGYVLTVTSHEGYGGDITFLVGIRTDGTVNGISFTSISETAGLGMKAKDEKFYGQFSDKKVESFAYTKTGAAKENEIDAISAATITTNAVTNGVNGALAFFSNELVRDGGAQ